MERKIKIKDIVNISITTAIIASLSLVSIPLVVPFTLQLLAIFFAMLYLGPYKGLIAIIAYIVLGIIGLPIFSSFQGGIGVILGPTGGFIIGFLLISILFLLFYKLCKENDYKKLILLVILLVFLYVFGYLWIGIVYNDFTSIKEAISYSFKLMLTSGWYLFILDLFKLLLAYIIYKKIKTISKA